MNKILVKYLQLVGVGVLWWGRTAQALNEIPGVPNKDISLIINNLVNWLLRTGIIVSILVLVWGSVNYITTLGDTRSAERAKKIITYAILGLLVMSVSYALIAAVNKIFTTP